MGGSGKYLYKFVDIKLNTEVFRYQRRYNYVITATLKKINVGIYRSITSHDNRIKYLILRLNFLPTSLMFINTYQIGASPTAKTGRKLWPNFCTFEKSIQGNFGQIGP